MNNRSTLSNTKSPSRDLQLGLQLVDTIFGTYRPAATVYNTVDRSAASCPRMLPQRAVFGETTSSGAPFPYEDLFLQAENSEATLYLSTACLFGLPLLLVVFPRGRAFRARLLNEAVVCFRRHVEISVAPNETKQGSLRI